MKHYFSRISSIVEGLIANPLIQIARFNIKSGYSISYLKQLQQRSGIQISEGLMNFYSEIGEFEISWMLDEDKAQELELENNINYYDVYGEIFIQDINSCLKQNQYKLHWSNQFQISSLPLEQKVFMEKFHPFDYSNPDTQEYSGFINKEDLLNDSLWYYKQGEGFGNMHLSIDQYISLLESNYGLVGWQRAIPLKIKGDVQVFDTLFKKVFP